MGNKVERVKRMEFPGATTEVCGRVLLLEGPAMTNDSHEAREDNAVACSRARDMAEAAAERFVVRSVRSGGVCTLQESAETERGCRDVDGSWVA